MNHSDLVAIRHDVHAHFPLVNFLNRVIHVGEKQAPRER